VGIDVGENQKKKEMEGERKRHPVIGWFARPASLASPRLAQQCQACQLGRAVLAGALFTSEKISDFAAVALLFLFNKYCLIMN